MTYKLLIVEDEWVISDSLSSMPEWQERNIDVVGTARTGIEALQWLDRMAVDLMITDIRMPDMDGLELLQLIHEQNLDTSVIVISAYDKFSYAQTALKYKAEGYILKPIDTDELFTTVDEIISRLPVQNKDMSPEGMPRTYHESLVLKARTYVEQNLAEPITLSEVADTVFLSAHHFGQIFKNVTNETFTSYITRTRMEKACQLLQNPELRLYEVSRQVGFVDARYFSKVFLKTYGVTPRKYREHALRRTSP
jgi:two-component system, response regulator YesN